MTQILEARLGNITPQMEFVAKEEGVDVSWLVEKVAQGRIVIPKNIHRAIRRPCGIGEGLSVKVNANLGTSSDTCDLFMELKKLSLAVEAGADTVMDLSTGGDLREIRRNILKNCPLPLGTVPIYQAVVETVEEKGGLVHLTPEHIFRVIEEQAREGVDFMTVHCGVTLSALELLRRQGRATDIVSRGGAFLATWMIYHERENPLYTDFQRVLEIAKEHDITLSLGDGL
ncbi:MAG: phosphomethylpyrimidine synthase ThiC, partial [Desulfatiglandales bacterium]